MSTERQGLENPSRREWLKRTTLAAAAIPVVEQLLSTPQASAEPARQNLSSFGSLREAYALAPEVTYLNHASIGTIPRQVLDAHQHYLEVCEANPWLHVWGKAWEEPWEEVRRKSAELLGCSTGEVAITHNTTEAFSLLAQGLDLGQGDEVLLSSFNHSGASVAFLHHAKTRGYTARQFDIPIADVPNLSADDIIDLHLREITSKTRLLVVPHVDNRVGLRLPLRRLAEEAKAKGVRWIAVDGAQTAGMLPIDVTAAGIDFFSTSGHKWIQSPKGLGLAFLSKTIQTHIQPMWVTWGQKSWQGTVRVFEDYGTRNLPAILALGDALDFQTRLSAKARLGHHRRLWEYAKKRVKSSSDLSWRSPTQWDLSAALYAIEVRGQTTAKLFERLFAEQGLVFRPFSTSGFELARLSPNLANNENDLDLFFRNVGG